MPHPEHTQNGDLSIPDREPVSTFDALSDVEQMLGLETDKLSPADVHLLGGLALEVAHGSEVGAVEADTVFHIPHQERYDEFKQ